MTTQTLTLTEFLLARVAEDEASAGRAGSFTPWSETFQNDNYGHLTVQPARVLAECEAKRRIVASVERALPRGTNGLGPSILRHLALPYADHPDYRSEWTP